MGIVGKVGVIKYFRADEFAFAFRVGGKQKRQVFMTGKTIFHDGELRFCFFDSLVFDMLWNNGKPVKGPFFQRGS
jgi:hypothetical protein